MNRFRLFALLLVFASLTFALVVGCSRADARSPKNVVLISIDTLRADHLGCYGAKGNPTPNIDRLAARGARFEKAYSAVPVTTPSHATLLSGTFPPFHGVRSNGSYALSDDRTTIAEALKKKGYQTGGFVGGFPLDHQFGFAQGFDVYDDDIKRAEQSMSPYDAERRGGTVVDKALAWYKERDQKKPFFLFVHMYDPHHPYSPPEPSRSKWSNDPYTGEIAYVDEQVGRILGLLEQDKIADDTLVVLVSDHGESLGEHGEATHMIFVYDATLRVPMIVAGPGVPKGKSVTEPARLVDVFPTIAASAGAELPKDVQGLDLAPAMDGSGKLSDKRSFYAESLLPQVQFDWAPLQSVRSGKWKYILAPQEELYDLDADPGETKNLFHRGADGKPEWASAETESAYRNMAHLMKKSIDDLSSPEAGKAAKQLDPESAKKLQSLGYLGSTSHGTTTGVDPMKLPDPKTRIALFNRAEEALALIANGKAGEAIDIYRKILEEYPDESWIKMTLARNLMGQKRYKEIFEVLTPATLAKFSTGNRAVAIGFRAGANEEQGKWTESLAEWDSLATVGPDSATQAAKGKANALIELKRYPEALPLIEKVAAAEPKNRETHLLFGYALLGVGRESDAIVHLAQARDLEPKGADGATDPKSAPLFRAANFYLKNGDKAKAATALRTLMAEDPKQAKGEASYVLSTLGAPSDDPNSQRLEASRTMASRGDFAGAARQLEQVIAAGGDTAQTQYDLSVCYFNLRKIEEARNALIRCMKADPAFAPAYADFGLISERTGDKEKAERYYRKAIDLKPDLYPALSRLGIFLSRTGRHPEAVTLLQRAAEVEPKNADAHHNLAIALKNGGRTAEAQKAEAVGQKLDQEQRRR